MSSFQVANLNWRFFTLKGHISGRTYTGNGSWQPQNLNIRVYLKVSFSQSVDGVCLCWAWIQLRRLGLNKGEWRRRKSWKSRWNGIDGRLLCGCGEITQLWCRYLVICPHPLVVSVERNKIPIHSRHSNQIKRSLSMKTGKNFKPSRRSSMLFHPSIFNLLHSCYHTHKWNSVHFRFDILFSPASSFPSHISSSW